MVFLEKTTGGVLVHGCVQPAVMWALKYYTAYTQHTGIYLQTL